MTSQKAKSYSKQQRNIKTKMYLYVTYSFAIAGRQGILSQINGLGGKIQPYRRWASTFLNKALSQQGTKVNAYLIRDGRHRCSKTLYLNGKGKYEHQNQDVPVNFISITPNSQLSKGQVYHLIKCSLSTSIGYNNKLGIKYFVSLLVICNCN